MLKKELREVYKKKRMALSDDEVILLSEKIIHRFLNEFKPVAGQKIHLFLPISKLKEIDTNRLIKYCVENQISVFVPKVIGSEMISVELTSKTELAQNSWGIWEPISNDDALEMHFDFVLTPLLYCDSQGNRIGYGKGFYDRFFSKINPYSKKIGLNYFSPKPLIDDVDPFDVKLDYLVLPEEVLSFGALP